MMPHHTQPGLDSVGEVVLAAFVLLGIVGSALLALGLTTKRRWATHFGVTCLVSLAAAWILGPYVSLATILVGIAAWFAGPASKRRDV